MIINPELRAMLLHYRNVTIALICLLLVVLLAGSADAAQRPIRYHRIDRNVQVFTPGARLRLVCVWAEAVREPRLGSRDTRAYVGGLSCVQMSPADFENYEELYPHEQ